MSYNKFNQYIIDKFFSSENKGNTILFSVDDEIISEFLHSEDLEYEEFQSKMADILNNNWWEANENYLGICAIQVFIAYKMQEDDEFSSNQYNPRLAKFIGIDTSALQKLYAKNQTGIWNKLKKFCNDNDFIINIPEARKEKGCYIQYPFSQALLNKEDLKKASIFFKRIGINRSEYISFKDFSQLIETADNGHCMKAHYYKVKKKLKKEFGCFEQLNRQIYNFFIDEWDGLYPHQENASNTVKSTYKKNQGIHLFLNKSYNCITVVDDEYEFLDKIFLFNQDVFCFIKKYQNLSDDEFLIFKIDTIDENAECVRKFEIGERYVIICAQNSKVSTLLPSLCNAEKKQNGIYEIFITQTLKKKANHHFWNKFFSLQSRGYKIEGGVKLAYKSWMQGCGPKITFNEKSVAWINGKKFEAVEIDCSDFSTDVYKIVKDSSIEKFEIKAPSNTKNEDCNGWKVDKQSWNPVVDNFQITGLINNFPKETNTSTITDWIKILTSKNINANYSSTVLRAIKRANYGI